MYILKIFTFHHLLFLIFSEPNHNPSPRTGPRDLLVTHNDCEENEQKTFHKYATNQVTQCESEPQAIETTNITATLYSKARARTLTGHKFTAIYSEKKVYIVHKIRTEIKIDWTTNLSNKLILKDYYISALKTKKRTRATKLNTKCRHK